MISWTWAFYLIGALYIIGPVLAWVLGGLALLTLYLGPAVRSDLRATGPVPPVVWAWILSMGAMLVILWIGHIDWSLGLAQTVKSSIGWAKGWALMALLPLAGACLPIRRAPLIRAHCYLGLVTLHLLPLFLIAPHAGLPQLIFTSPLKIVGGPGPEYFSVFLYTMDPGTSMARWQFYVPWSPFAGLLGVTMILFAREDPARLWRRVGVAAGIAMILMSRSRMALVALPLCLLLPAIMPLILRSWAWAALSGVVASMAVFGATLVQFAQDGMAAFRTARADSSRVRDALQRIAEDRWQMDAFWFGHGIVHPGSHLIEYMPIGSHHTWFGLLFVKGLTGLIALLIPMLWQTALALLDAARGPRGRLPLGIMMVFAILSFGENIEIETYMFWPSLIVLGIHAREMQCGRTTA
ncbi:MAG: O-antigen ligase domain-containing protein [Pseudomonadota bacterium]